MKGTTNGKLCWLVRPGSPRCDAHWSFHHAQVRGMISPAPQFGLMKFGHGISEAFIFQADETITFETANQACAMRHDPPQVADLGNQHSTRTV